MIKVSEKISLHENEICFKYIHASGPGGQNVNKVATAAQLRFDVRKSSSIPDDVKERLMQLAAGKINSKGELIITARRCRSQERNRQDAIERLLNLIRKALLKPKIRKKRKLSSAEKQQRLDNKRRNALQKRLRKPVNDW